MKKANLNWGRLVHACSCFKFKKKQTFLAGLDQKEGVGPVPKALDRRDHQKTHLEALASGTLIFSWDLESGIQIPNWIPNSRFRIQEFKKKDRSKKKTA